MDDKKKLVVLITCGLDDERSSVAWSISNGGINSGLDVTIFLAGSGVDWVRKGAADKVHLNPLDPSMKEMVDNFMANGSGVLVCPPCAGIRGYTEDDLIDGATLAGSASLHDLLKAGASSLCF